MEYSLFQVDRNATFIDTGSYTYFSFEDKLDITTYFSSRTSRQNHVAVIVEGVVDIFPEINGVKVDEYLLVAVCVWVDEGPGALEEIKAGVLFCMHW